MGKVGAGLGIGGIVIAIIFSLLTGEDPTQAIDQATQQQQPVSKPTHVATKEENEMAEFVSVVLKDCEDVWHKLLPGEYKDPVMVLYTGGDQSGCGKAEASFGPFYCPADEGIYIDLSFFQELKSDYNAPGDFAVAYVVAHEVGHHVQNLLGTTYEVEQQEARLSEKEANKLSVRLELQADFYAGVWAHHAQRMKNILDPGDIEEALGAASAVGDDKLQEEANGYVVQESFTHGTSEQRMRWFKKGFDTGDIDKGDTFSAKKL